jgi:diguanylate cyclase (GGDEF)-like protein
LRRVARVLVRVTRGSDVVARLGGDEFGVLLPHVEELGARRCAERILAELAITEVLAPGQVSAPIACSIGAALFPLHAATPELLFECADKALYQSKRAGRQRATMYAPEQPVPARASGSSIRMHTLDGGVPTPPSLAQGLKK